MLEVSYFSYGTIYGTVRKYDTDGNDTGAQDISGYGIFFTVKTAQYQNINSILEKSIGTGITITNGTGGYFSITFSSQDLDRKPQDYFYDCFLNAAGTTFVATTSQIKSIGSGIFRISPGAKYGTN